MINRSSRGICRSKRKGTNDAYTCSFGAILHLWDIQVRCIGICNPKGSRRSIAMAAPRSRRSNAERPAVRSLTLRLDDESKAFLSQAAKLRRISLSDYVRNVTVAHARREVLAAREQTLVMTPAEQLAFWNALAAPVALTAPQRRLGSLMRGGAR
jgi:uncharacterized protein (DUF1778 family)